jgi:DNA repair protein RecO (recombination protein O)
VLTVFLGISVGLRYKPIMQIQVPALLCAVRPHAENGVIIRAFSAAHGLLAAYVPGGRSRRLRGALQPGNTLLLNLAQRSEGQLATASVELMASRSALATSRAALAVLDWATGLTASALPEGLPHPHVHDALEALLDACAADAPPLTLGEALVRYELLLLAELGFGLDLTCCAATGSRADLVYVSPRSAQAVSQAAGAPWASRLLPLPGFLLGPVAVTPSDLSQGLTLAAHFLARHVLTGSSARLLESRALLCRRLGAEAMDEPPPPG